MVWSSLALFLTCSLIFGDGDNFGVESDNERVFDGLVCESGL